MPHERNYIICSWRWEALLPEEWACLHSGSSWSTLQTLPLVREWDRNYETRHREPSSRSTDRHAVWCPVNGTRLRERTPQKPEPPNSRCIRKHRTKSKRYTMFPTQKCTDTLTNVLYSSVLGHIRGQKNGYFENLLLRSENNFHPN